MCKTSAPSTGCETNCWVSDYSALHMNLKYFCVLCIFTRQIFGSSATAKKCTVCRKIKVSEAKTLFSFFHLGDGQRSDTLKNHIIKSDIADWILNPCCSAPSCGEQRDKKPWTRREETTTSHLKVTEDALDVTQDPLPVGPVGLQHLLHCLSHSQHAQGEVLWENRRLVAGRICGYVLSCIPCHFPNCRSVLGDSYQWGCDSHILSRFKSKLQIFPL